MIVAALALAAIAAFDLSRRPTRRRPLARRLALAAIAAGALAAAGLLDGWTAWVLVAPAAVALWAWSMPDSGRSRYGLWPVAALGILVALGVWLGSSPTGAEAVVLLPRTAPVPLAEALLVLGGYGFLLESANLVVRVALRRGGVPATEAEPTAPLDVHEPGRRTSLKGGRIIGPLERLLLATLALTGAWVLISALIAAKGIVRFPEISRDSADGDRAEYFLVGSMVSWTLALAVAGMLWWAAAPR